MRSLAIFATSVSLCLAQPQAPAQQSEPVAVFKVEVVARTTKAINYRHRSGSTKIDFKGTPLLPAAKGEGTVESKQGRIDIDANFRNLAPATKYGPEYLTYVLWAITPEGRPTNLGEILLNGTNSKISVSSELQAFGLIVTAEPYFAVTMPSDVVVLENMVRPDTLGKIDEIDAKFELFQRGIYSGSGLERLFVDPRVPLELFEARNALRIAKWQGADHYAPETYDKAQKLLVQAEEYQIRKQNLKKPVAMIAREAVQTAEDARAIGVRRIEEEKLAKERADAAEREAKAKAEKDAEAARRAAAEAAQKAENEARLRAEADRLIAEKKKMEAELESARAAKAQAEAEASRATALAQEQKARADAEAARAVADKARASAEESDRMRLKAEEDKRRAEADQQRLRTQLLEQFNLILETRDTARGLVVNMADVLFDSAKYTLRPPAREKLAKLSGIVLAHPGLRLEVEGHTDSIGSEDYNQKLSEQRAESVRGYLLEQKIPETSVTAMGFGKTMPVASNDNAKGRQQNRRVEIIVSGEVIGAKIGAAKTGSP